jgi:hypothetical protein
LGHCHLRINNFQKEATNVIIWKHRGEEARIKAGSGEKMRKVGAKGAPSAGAFKAAAKTAKKPKKGKK